MWNQLGDLIVIRLILDLPRQLKVVGATLNQLTSETDAGTHNPFQARLLAQTAAAKDTVVHTNRAAPEGNREPENESNLSMITEDVPMYHLFLLDMKIGR